MTNIKKNRLRSTSSTRKGIVNPQVFKWMEKKLRYCFYRTSSYFQVHEILKGKNYITVYPCLGVYDIFIQHLDNETFSLMIELGGVKSLLEDESIFIATEFYKFGGFPVKEPTDDLLTQDDRENLKILSEDFDSNNVGEEKRQQYLNNNFLLGSRLEKDIKKSGNRRALTLITLPYDDVTIHNIFQAALLKPILNISPVISVVKGESSFGFNYIVEVIAKPYEIDHIVDIFHTKAYELRFKIGTRTIELWYPPLVEKHLSNLIRDSIIFDDIWLINEALKRGKKINEIPENIKNAVAFLTRNRDTVYSVKNKKTKSWLLESLISYSISIMLNDLLKDVRPFTEFVENAKIEIIEKLITVIGEEESRLKKMAKKCNWKNWKLRNMSYGDVIDSLVKLNDNIEAKILTEQQMESLRIANKIRNSLIHQRYSEIEKYNIEQTFEIVIQFLVDFISKRIIVAEDF